MSKNKPTTIGMGRALTHIKYCLDHTSPQSHAKLPEDFRQISVAAAQKYKSPAAYLTAFNQALTSLSFDRPTRKTTDLLAKTQVASFSFWQAFDDLTSLGGSGSNNDPYTMDHALKKIAMATWFNTACLITKWRNKQPSQPTYAQAKI